MLELAKSYRVKGVILVTQKYCDTHLYDRPWMESSLKEEGLPVLVVDHSDTGWVEASSRRWLRHLSKCWSSITLETKQDKPIIPFKPARLAVSAALGTLNEKYYRDLANAKQEGRPVVWITSMTPIELVYAFDGIPFFRRTTPHSVPLER